jgi:hypothetical protein
MDKIWFGIKVGIIVWIVVHIILRIGFTRYKNRILKSLKDNDKEAE